MNASDSTSGQPAGGEAADWFVRLDSGGEPHAEAALSTWLERPANERALQRVELAVALGRRLAADPRSALCAEASRAVRLGPRRQTAHRALAWGGALAAALLVAVFVVQNRLPPAAVLRVVPLRAAQLVAVDAPSNPVVVLPSGVVVDASAVAVLPFIAEGDTTLATGLEREVVAALRSVPGLYVIGDAAVQPYAATELGAADLGGLLGARGLVDAGVELVDGRVRVSARLRAATTGATLWQAELDRPVDELRAVRDEIADNVATTMLDSRLRPLGARNDAAITAVAAVPYPRQ